MMERQNLYVVPGFRGKSDIDPKEITKYLTSISKVEDQRRADSPLDVRYQDFELPELDKIESPLIVDLIKEISQTFAEYINESILVYNAWTICHGYQHQTYPHTHGKSDVWACVYWSQVPEGSAPLELYPRGLTEDTVHIQPVEGEYLIFPGIILHGVRQNTNPDELRVSMSMNMGIARKEEVDPKDLPKDLTVEL